MSYINIKFLPANISLYIYTVLINLFFSLIFTENIFWIITEQTKFNNNSKILLIIPKSLENQEEKRDLIFNQLSLDSAIISVEAEDSKKVKILLADILENTSINDKVIPEVYNLIVKNKKNINVNNLNNKISKIMENARIFSTYTEPKAYLKKTYIILLFSISIFIITNYFLVNNLIFKIKNYLTLSRSLGIRDLIIFRNLNIGFFLIIFISFIVWCIIYFLFIKNSHNIFLDFDKNLYIFYSVNIFCYFFILLNFNIKLYLFLKKIL